MSNVLDFNESFVGVFHKKEYFVKHGYSKALSFLELHNLAGAPSLVHEDYLGRKYVMMEKVYDYYFAEVYTLEEGKNLFPEVFI